MKYLSLLVPLLFAWVICANADQPPIRCPNENSYCSDKGECKDNEGKAVCHCDKDRKGQFCEIDSSEDKPLDKIPPNYEEVEPDARTLVYQIKCTALTTPGRIPLGCGFGYALQHFRDTEPLWEVIIWVKVLCCCWPCEGNGAVPGQPPFCRDVFPTLGKTGYITSDNWMCAPPPAYNPGP